MIGVTIALGAFPDIGDEPLRSDPAAGAYARFSIVEPENGGSVMANTAAFEVRVAADPPLRLGIKPGTSFGRLPEK